MDDEDNLIDPSTGFSAVVSSSWPPLSGGDSDGAYLFGTERDSSILSQFGWNFPYADFDRIDPDVHGSSSTVTVSIPKNTTAGEMTQVEIKAGDVLRNNPSMSSSSTEDRPEISTASGGGGGGNSTSETA